MLKNLNNQRKLYVIMKRRREIKTSFADPDPDLVFLGHPDPDPFSQKDPCKSNFRVIKLSKIQFRPNIFYL